MTRFFDARRKTATLQRPPGPAAPPRRFSPQAGRCAADLLRYQDFARSLSRATGLPPLAMSTEPIQSENAADSSLSADSTPAPGDAPIAAAPNAQSAATEAAAQPTAAPATVNPAESTAGLLTLPPRIDGGEDLDNVLGEVSRMFGSAPGHAAPLASLAEDTINDHLDELTNVPAAQAPELPRQPQEVPMDSAADLFHSPPPLPDPSPLPAPPPAAASPEPAAVEAKDVVPPAPAAAAPPPPNSPSNAPIADVPEIAAHPGAPPTFAERPIPGAPDAVVAPAGPAVDTAPSDALETHSPVSEGAGSETPVDPVGSAEPGEPAAADNQSAPPAGEAKPSLVVRVARGASATVGALGQTAQRLPNGARIAAAVVVALILGWVGGARLSRSSAVSGERVAAEASAENSSAEIEAGKAKITALEEELGKSKHDRELAQHERDQARERLEKSTVLLRTQERTDAAQHARDAAARQQALDEYRQAEERLHLMELRAYDAQLARVRDVWQRSPGLAAALLEDAEGCQPKLRDFAWGYFYGRAKNDRATWRGAAPTNAVAWSPDNTLVASAGQDGAITLRDAASGKQLSTFAAHAGGVSALAFSQHGDRLASAGADSTVKLWNVPERRLEATFFGHLGKVLSVAIAPDASALVSGGDDGTVKFWNVASRRAVATRWGHPRNHEPDDADDPTRFVHAVAFSPDGRLVTSGGYEVVRIWDADANEKTTLAIPEGDVSALAFSPDSTTLAIGSASAISLRDVDSLLVRSGPRAVASPVTGLAFSTDGAWLAATAGEQGFVFSRIVRDPALQIKNKSRPHARLEPAGYDLSNPRRLSGHDGTVTGISFAPSGELTATCGADGTVRLWDVRGGIVDKTEPDVVVREIARSAALAYSPDSRCLAVGTADSIRLWDARAGVELARLANRSGDVRRLAFSPDGAHLASAGRDWPILIWTLGGQRVELALNGHTGGVNSLAYATDGKTLISGADDATVRLWDATNGQTIAALTGHTGPVLSAALSPDGKLAASGGVDRTVRLWNVERKQTTTTLTGHGGPVVAVVFAPDGRFLVSAEGRSTVAHDGVIQAAQRPLRLWRMPRGTEPLTFGPAGVDINDVAFSPDSKTLAVSGPSGVTLWDPRTGEIRESLRPVPSGLAGGLTGTKPARWPVAFAPDGQSLAAGGDVALSIWSAAPFGPAVTSRPNSEAPAADSVPAPR